VGHQFVVGFGWGTMQDIEDIVVNGNGAEPGHIIVTSIDGRNGQAKQVFQQKKHMLCLDNRKPLSFYLLLPHKS
jgi:hypothetical protein